MSSEGIEVEAAGFTPGTINRAKPLAGVRSRPGGVGETDGDSGKES